MGELQELSGLAFSTMSRHVSELEVAGLVEQTKEGRWVWCTLAEGQEVHRVLECIWLQLANDPTLAVDRRRAQRLRARRKSTGCGANVRPCLDGISRVAADAAPAQEEVG